MSVQAQISGDIKIRDLEGGLYAEGGIVTSKPFGEANGFATLGGDGKVPSSQLPSYVDDVVEVANYAALPIPGETGKIYITLDTNYVYRWAGSTYVQIIDTSAVWGAITGTLSNQTDLQSALDAKVPYTGATGNVDLGTYGIKADYSQFNLTPSSVPTTVGTLSWDSEYRTLQLIDGDGDTTLQIGQEQRALIHNGTGSTLTDGQVVYVTGSTGQLPSVALASNALESTSSVTFGVVTETIPHGSDGFVTISGMVNGLNTLAFNEGDALYLGATAGTFTNVKPTAPANLVLIGYVIKKAGGNGSIFVKIQNGYELEELHDVSITSVANNEGIFWDSATSLWKNKTIAGALGYTPANAATYVPYSGATNDLNLGSHDLYLASVFAQGTLLSNNGLRIEGDGVSEGGNLQFKQYASVTAGTLGYTTLSANDSTSFNIYFNQPSSTNYKNVKLSSSLLTNNIIRTYSFPDASGTLALTSDLSSYVPYTGATGSVDIGNNNYYGGTILLKQSAPSTSTTGYFSISGSTGTGTAGLVLGLGSGTTSSMAYPTSGNYTYTFPASNGTIALTSNIPTVSGASGQVTYFNGTSSVTGSNNFFWDATNNRLGIGLTNPQRALEIYSATADSHLRLSGSAPSVSLGEAITGSIYQAKFGLATANGQYASGAVAGDFVILSQTGATIFMTNATEKMRVNTSGRLLLGTTTDNGSLLQVAGSATFSGLATIKSVDITESSANTYGTLAIRGNSRGGEIDFYNTSTLLAAIYADASKNLYLQTDGTTRLTISSSGAASFSSSVTAANITLIAGQTGLKIFDNGYPSSFATSLRTASGAIGVLQLGNNNDNYILAGNTAANGFLVFRVSCTSESISSGIEAMRITSGGALYVNQTSASAAGAGVKCQIATDVLATGSLAGFFWENRSGGVTSNSNWYGWYATGGTTYFYNGSANIASINSATGVYTPLSDINKKKDFEASTIGLDAILGLKPTLFRMKSEDESTPKTLGFIAQDVKDIIPQAYVESEDFIGLQDRPIIAVLVKAVQEIKSEKDSEIAELKQIINNLSAKVTALENK